MSLVDKVTISQVKGFQDATRVELLAKQTWTHHYTPIIGSAQVEYMLDKYQSTKAILKQIQDGYEYFFINLDQASVGYMSIKVEEKSIFLSKIYIDSEHHGKGLGKAGMQYVYKQAEQLGLDKIWLTVNKQNTNSIKAYERLGFLKTEELVIDIGHGFVMDDYKMEKQL